MSDDPMTESSSPPPLMPPPPRPTTKDPLDLNEFLDDTQASIDRMKKAIKQPMYMVPDVDASNPNHDFHPDNCLWTDQRKEFYYAFKYGGAVALARALWKYGRDQESATSSRLWRYFREDEDGAKALPGMIMTMDPDVVEAVICNNLSYRYMTNKKFRSKVHRWLEPQTTPGVYCNQWADSGTDPAGTSQQALTRQDELGKGFSITEWQQLYDLTGTYLDPADDDDERWVKDVDGSLLGSKKSDYVDRDIVKEGSRYFQNKNNKKVIEQWRGTVKELILDHAHTTLIKSEQCKWNLTHIGIGVNTAERHRQHTYNSATGALFGLLNAIIRLKLPQFQLRQYQLFYITDLENSNLAEAFLSTMASSYSWMGGLNGKLAGGTAYQSMDLKTAEAGIQKNIRFVFQQPRQGAFKYGIEDQKRKTESLRLWEEALRTMGNYDDAQREMQTRVEKIEEKYEAMRKKLKDLQLMEKKVDLEKRRRELQEQDTQDERSPILKDEDMAESG